MTLPHRSPRGAAMAVLVVAALLGLAAARMPHPGPPVNVEVEIGEGRIAVLIQAEQATFNPWLGVLPGRILPAPLPPEKAESYRLGAAEFLAANNPFTVNGERVLPEVREARLTDAFGSTSDPPILELELDLPCEGWPRSVGLTWETWEGTAGIDGPRIPVLFRWPVGEYVFGSLSPEEPGYVWHALPGLGEPRVFEDTSGPPVEPDLPLASVLLGAALVLAVPLLRRLRPPFVLVLALYAGGGAAVWALRDLRVEAPWSRVPMPSREEALAMFATLHGNIYQAFASRQEEDVYELLSRSVAPAILDELYGEVYESMILRGEGGAVCDVQKVEVLEREVSFPEEPQQDGPLAFEVDWRWRVHGLVSHFGHRHERTNQYHARYTVAHDGASWKIAEVEILDHQRIQDYGGY